MRSIARPLVLATLLTVLMILPVINGQLFCDDFNFRLDHPREAIVGSLVRLHPYRLYRPLELSVVALSQTLVGRDTWPVHLASIMVHLGLVALGLHACRRWRASGRVLVLFALLMSVSQLLPSAVGGNDTISLVMGTFFGCLALWCFWPAAHRGGERHSTIGLAALALSLLSKESSLGYVPVMAALSLVEWRPAARSLDGPGSERPPAGHHAAVLTPEGWIRIGAIGLVTTVYLLWRGHVGAEGPRFDGTGAWAVGLNIPANLAMLWSAALLPVSTIEVFTGAVERRWLWPATGVLLAGGFVAAVLRGFGRSSVRALLPGGVAASITVSPVLFRGHVSELYAYALLPGVAMAGALAMDRLLAEERRAVRIAVSVLLGVMLLSQAAGTIDKSRRMAANGAAAARQMEELLALARTMPTGGCLVLLDPPSVRPQYSVFCMDDFRLTPVEEVQRLSGRHDLRVIRVHPGGPGRIAPRPDGATWVTLEGHHVVPATAIGLASVTEPLRLRDEAPAR